MAGGTPPRRSLISYRIRVNPFLLAPFLVPHQHTVEQDALHPWKAVGADAPPLKEPSDPTLPDDRKCETAGKMVKTVVEERQK